MARRAKKKVTPLERLATSYPRFTVLGDHPLEAENYTEDSFGLARRLGPAFDIIRHPDTKTPLAVAIYGPWGSGKTSAMRVMEGMAETWNKEGKPGPKQEKIKLRPVWFYPWKYHTREDVWRGLVSEVILSCIDVRRASAKTVATALVDFGRFLGRTFVDTVMAPKLKAGVEGAGAEVNLAEIKNAVVDNFREVAHPEKPYLNEFEDALKRWVKRSCGTRSRMIVFIDDLDRCLPDVALEVLEALKLYLNIPRLVFVLGVDKGVIESLVEQHYKGLGLEENQSANYLAKMFQVEVTLGASGPEIKDFLEMTISGVRFDAAELESDHREVFASVVGSLAGRNPREIKRLVSSAVMLGAGWALSGGDGEDTKERLEFAQGIQFFLLHTILERKFHRGHLVFNENVQEFFEAWSKLRREKKTCPPYIPEAAMLAESDAPKRGETIEEIRKMRGASEASEKLPEDCAAYDDIWNDSRWRGYRRFLGDADLGELMKIPFPPPEEATGLAEAVATSEPSVDPILAAVAKTLKKPATEVTKDDLETLRKLNLRDPGVSDIGVLEQLTGLTELDLRDTGVSDIRVLGNLTGLTVLDLRRTGVSDITALVNLTGLRFLSLSDARVSDIGALENLTELHYLSLSETDVCDISVLENLTELKWLHLRNTDIRDISVLEKLIGLQYLDLSGTKVSDIGVFEKLIGLTKLDLRGTDVSDISVLENLPGLETLSLSGTAVSDISVIEKLAGLEILSLFGTGVSDIRPLKDLQSLKQLHLSNTKVSADDVEEFKKTYPNCEVTF